MRQQQQRATGHQRQPVAVDDRGSVLRHRLGVCQFGLPELGLGCTVVVVFCLLWLVVGRLVLVVELRRLTRVRG
jgi:hypothetical protein